MQADNLKALSDVRLAQANECTVPLAVTQGPTYTNLTPAPSSEGAVFCP